MPIDGHTLRLRERHTQLNHTGLGLLAVFLATACGSTADRQEATVRDSAGIRIVENDLASPAPAAPFEMSIDPYLDLGGDQDQAGPAFTRIAGVRLRAAGGVLVADEGESRIHAFDAAGRLDWTVGRPGDGPGEFRLIADFGTGPADSAWVWDFGLRRLTFLDGAGRVVRIIRMEAPLSAPGVAGRLDDGTFILQEHWTAAGSSEGPGLRRAPAAIVRLAADASSLDTLAVLPGREVFLTVEDGRAVMAAPLFARRTLVTAGGDAVFAGDQASFEIRRYGDGGLQLVIRGVGQDLSINAEEAHARMDAILDEVPETERPSRRSFLESMDRPTTRPAFEALLQTDSAGLWVGGRAAPGRTRGEVSWRVFDAQGRLLGQIDMPSGFEPRDVRNGRIAGIWRDELGSEHVRVYRLTNRPGPQ